MPNDGKKGISVRVEPDLHAEVSRYIQEHGMTMSEFVVRALENELHPKIKMKEGNSMENTRTIAFQVPEDLYLRIKDYLQRNDMTQKQFFISLIEDELEREQAELETRNEAESGEPDLDEEIAELDEDLAENESEGVSDEDEDPDEDESEDEEESEDEGFSMSM